MQGLRPEEEEIFEFTLIQVIHFIQLLINRIHFFFYKISVICMQRIGGSWDGYWLTDSLHLDGDGFSSKIAY